VSPGDEPAHLVTRHTGYVESFHALFKSAGCLCQSRKHSRFAETPYNSLAPTINRFNESFRLRSSNCDASSARDSSAKGTIAMAKVVKVIELLSQSPESWEDAAQGAVDQASKTLRNIRSLYPRSSRAEVDNAKINNYRINAKVTFDLERE
jgi:hypothetical protein